MKYVPGYTDVFLSPVTGKLRNISSLPSLSYNYIFKGGKDNETIESPILKDLKLDIVGLKHDVHFLPHKKFYIGNLHNKRVITSKIWQENLPYLYEGGISFRDAHKDILKSLGVTAAKGGSIGDVLKSFSVQQFVNNCVS